MTNAYPASALPAPCRPLREGNRRGPLAALEQLRKLTAGTVACEKDVERAKEFRVKLRVVA